MLRMTKTETGMVRGVAGNNARITVYKGIPFAADTSGENRWRAPQPAEPWEGVRDCFVFPPITMQKTPGEDPDAFYSKEWHVDPDIAMSEDSLALNIWTPAKTTDDKLPVYVWVFGGGLTEGYSHEMEFDGEHMASRGIVVVSVAYRLNVFGFLAHPDLTRDQPDAPANFGYLDVKAGLEWVKRNIANFGGDPDNITIGGQSAGGLCVMAQLASPTTEGLIQKATIQSSSGGFFPAVYPPCFFGPYRSLEASEKQGAAFVKEYLGCDTIAEARKLDAFFIRDKFVEYMEKTGHRFVQCVDGKFLEKDPTDYFINNEIHRVPLITGYTTDEVNFLPKGDTLDELVAWGDKNLNGHGKEYIDTAIKQAGSTDVEAVREAARININRTSNYMIGNLYEAQGKPVFTYEFNPSMPGDDAGSFHSGDLWFSFETLANSWRPFDGHHYDVARKMCNYWCNFIKTGNPNGKDNDGTDLPFWPEYKDGHRNMNFFDEVSLSESGPSEVTDLIVKLNYDPYFNKD